MLEFLVTLKVWSEYIIPVAILAVALIGAAVIISFQIHAHSRKIKWLKSNGFVRYLIGVPSVGNSAFYGWRNSLTGKQIDERDLKNIGYSELKTMKE